MHIVLLAFLQPLIILVLIIYVGVINPWHNRNYSGQCADKSEKKTASRASNMLVCFLTILYMILRVCVCFCVCV